MATETDCRTRVGTAKEVCAEAVALAKRPATMAIRCPIGIVGVLVGVCANDHRSGRLDGRDNGHREGVRVRVRDSSRVGAHGDRTRD